MLVYLKHKTCSPSCWVLGVVPVTPKIEKLKNAIKS